MPNLSYINGYYCSYNDSKIHINDRGYHFGDSVYEVILFNEDIFYDFDDVLESSQEHSDKFSDPGCCSSIISKCVHQVRMFAVCECV